MHPARTFTEMFRTKANWSDLLVGASIAGVILPEAIAYAGLANLQPTAGIIAACTGLLIYGLIGTSRFAIVTATSSSAAVLLAATRSIPRYELIDAAQLVSAVVMTTGLLFLLCSAFRLGRIAHFIARPVVRGLAMGLATTIVLRQFASMASVNAVHHNALALLYELLRGMHGWNINGIVLGAITVLFLNLCKRAPRVPGPLLVLLIGVILSISVDLRAFNIDTVGDIALSESNLWRWHWPELAADQWLRIAELSVALMLILFAESYGSIRTSALQQGDVIHVNRDLLALGCANLCSGLLQGMPVGAGYSATTTNQAIGARSNLAGLSAAIYILIVLWMLLKYFALIPEPMLAAIIIFAMQHALSIASLRPYFKWRRDRLIVMVAIIAVLVFGILDGLLASIALSLILLIRGLAQPRISVLGRLRDTHDYVPMNSHADIHAVPGKLIVRPDEPLFFANVDDMFEKAMKELQRSSAVNTLILSLEESPSIDSTVLESLDLFSRQLHEIGCKLVLARLKEPVQHVLQRAQLQYLDESVLNTTSVAAVVSIAS